MARSDVPVCRVDERLAAVRARVEAAGWDACVALNDEGVVFGLLREPELRKGGDASVGHVMKRNPSTYRPHVPVTDILEQMIEAELANVPITTSDGRLVGLLRKQDAVAALRTTVE